eukprot:scaffold1084_cov114-Isochrysis_galbana.AAC.9
MSGASGSRSSGSGVIGRAVGHHLHEVCSLFAPPHDNPPSLAGEGDSIPQHKSKHTSRAHGDEARKAHKGGGKRNLHLVFRGRWISTRGPSHTPFGGVRQLASTYRQCGMWGQQGPTRQLILPQDV